MVPAAPPRASALVEPTAPSRHRRQLADNAPSQAGQAAPQPGPVPLIVRQAEIVNRAYDHSRKRDGAACLAALDEVKGEWVPDLVIRVRELRGDCLLLSGRCDEGKKLLEQSYLNNRAYSPDTSEGLLSAHFLELCPIGSIRSVDKRIMAVSSQAKAANLESTNQSHWCSTLERTLLADTRSGEVQSCFADFAAAKPRSDCGPLFFNLREAYRFLSECYLRDKNCREGVRLDVMHNQLELLVMGTDDPNVARWCKPTRTVETYPACSAASEEAERRCMERVQAADRAGIEKVTPEILPR